MGLAKSALQFLAHEHKRKSFTGPALTLGRQDVHATFDEVLQLLKTEKVMPTALSLREDLRTNIPAWRGTPREGNTSDVIFFKLLGVNDLMALDCSTYENPDIVVDLNLPVPDELRSQFDLILDGGTIEHVFDAKQALMNIALMLKPGGRIIHMAPMNNYVDHGFYQFSPTTFFDYYGVNGFADLRCVVAKHHPSDISAPFEFVEYSPNTHQHFRSADHQFAVFFTTEKSLNATFDKVPVQSYYSQVYKVGVRF
ncbi:MAG: class I SAM-dependent methyltransferase [Candidatus Poribacteria bacterium]|nr:class I SAM-dependent methyltransferase [Candidatus Poribacteria bacterium]